MLTIPQLLIQTKLQNRLNTVVNPQWIEAGYNWTTAMMVEGVEALDHWGWKWWKKQEPNVAQVHIELVDIWHFMLSHTLVSCKGDEHDAAAQIRFNAREGAHMLSVGDVILDLPAAGFITLTKAFVSEAALGKASLTLFAHMCRTASLSWDELHKIYVAKNVLNLFRQAHGYKEGTYIKTWNGREDNETLHDLMLADADATPVELLNGLEKIYASVEKMHANHSKGI